MPSLTGTPQPRVRSESAPPTVEVPAGPAPISQEARQMVQKAGKASPTPTIATNKDIEEIHFIIDGIKTGLPDAPTGKQVVEDIKTRACTPENLRIVISLLGKDHPKAQELRAKVEQAGEDRTLLKAARTEILAELQPHIEETIKQAHAALEQQMATERPAPDSRSLIRRVLFSGNDRSSDASAQQNRLSEQGQAHIDASVQLRKLASGIMDRRPDPVTLAQAIDALGSHPEAASLKARLEAPGQSPASLKSLRNDIVRTLHAQVKTLEDLGHDEQQASTQIRSHKGQGAEEVVGYISLVASLVSSTNSALKVAANSAEGFMGVAGSTVGIAFGGLHLLTESLALRRNVIRLNDAVSRSEGAKLVLMPAEERPGKIAELETQISALSKPRWFRTASGRATDVEKLQSKLTALKAMGTTESTTEAKAIARQVMASAALGHKALRVAKNLAGLAVGAIAISVAAGALATPVGWVAAGVVFAATIGLVTYNRLKTINKEQKIAALLDNRQVAASEIIKLKQMPETSERGTKQFKAMQRLAQQQEITLIQLLTVSPRVAANTIIAGLKAMPPDEQMRTLATQALNVPAGMTQAPFSPQQEAELKEYLMRGLPMQPKI